MAKVFHLERLEKGVVGRGNFWLYLKEQIRTKQRKQKQYNFSYEISWRALKVKVSEINITIEQHT